MAPKNKSNYTKIAVRAFTDIRAKIIQKYRTLDKS